MPEVSIIIPLYNKGPYVRRALDSVFAQTFKDYEVIVVDDGSTDDGPAQVITYNDPRLSLIRQANSGAGAARNRGLQESRGEYVAFLDADDEWLHLFLEVSIRALHDHKSCSLSTSAYFLGEQREDISTLFRERGITEGEWELTNNISDKHLLACIFAVNSCSTVCKKNILLKYGGFYSKDKCLYGEDYHLWLKIIFNCKIYRLSTPLWWYHLENSEIGVRKGNLPLHPFMQNPDDIRKYCPESKKELLERWFALYAGSMAHEYLFRNQIDNVEFMIKNFPSIKRVNPLSYFKLMLKLKMPILMKMKEILKLHRVTLNQ